MPLTGVNWKIFFSALVAFCSVALIGRAESIMLAPVADTTLFENSPDNNLGATDTLVVGSTAKDLRGRALLQFDIAGQLPAGAVVTSAMLHFDIERAPGFGAVNSTFELRRMLVSWGEGAKSSMLGATATAGEATWKARFAPGTLWSAPGGAEGVDFASTVSAIVPVTGVGSYLFASGSNLVADVQFWLDQPAQNFGWLCRSQSESEAQTARRISSRENAARAPMLMVEYAAAAPPAITITSVSLSPAGVSLVWSGGKPPYQLQTAAEINASWTNVGAPVTTNSVTAAASGGIAFFRVAGAAP